MSLQSMPPLATSPEPPENPFASSAERPAVWPEYGRVPAAQRVVRPSPVHPLLSTSKQLSTVKYIYYDNPALGALHPVQGCRTVAFFSGRCPGKHLDNDKVCIKYIHLVLSLIHI